MIHMQAIDFALVERKSLVWGLASNLFDDEQQKKLSSAYPQTGFNRCIRDSGMKKHYSFNLLNFVVDNCFMDNASSTIDEIWIDLAKNLLSENYVAAMSDKLGINLMETKKSIGFYKFDQGDWVSPHIDNEDKILTQIFYFNSFWSSDWGGAFQILRSNDMQDVSFSLPPFSNFSAFIARSDTAWHMVTPVKPNAQNSRLSMQLEFIRR